VSGSSSDPRRRAPIAVVVGFNLAILMAFLAAAGSVIDYVPSVQRRALGIHMIAGLSAIILVAACWRWTPRGGRGLGVAIVAAAALGTADAVVRLCS